MKSRLTICCLILALAATFAAAEQMTMTVTNPADSAVRNPVITIPASQIGYDLPVRTMTAVMPDGTKIPAQLDDLDGDGIADEFSLVVGSAEPCILQPGERVQVTLHLETPWEGASFADARESWRFDRYAALDCTEIAYGLYGEYGPGEFAKGLQWDCYAKRPAMKGLCLDDLADVNYHNDNPVAVDIFLVGNSFGLGGLIMGDTRPLHGKNATYTQTVVADGPVRGCLRVDVEDFTTLGGEYDMTIFYSLYAHNWFIDTEVHVAPSGPADEMLGVGMRKYGAVSEFLADENAGILAQWGNQDGIIGQAGLAVLFQPQHFGQFSWRGGEDDAYVVHLAPSPQGKSDLVHNFRLLEIWSEDTAFADAPVADHFMSRIKSMAAAFNTPPAVSCGR